MADAKQELQGFTVAGYVGDAPSATNGRIVAVLAEDVEQALVHAAAAHPEFKPVGAMSKAELLQHLQLIRELEAGT